MEDERFIINPQESGAYKMPTKTYFGSGSLSQLAGMAQVDGFKNILLITGGHFKTQSEFARVEQDLGDISKLTIYEPTIKKSDYATINTLTDFCRQQKFDAIVAIGGGTIIDSAKSAAILSVHEGPVEDYVSKKTRNLSKKGVTFIAIPTTAGTGSEVTPWATIWGDDSRKYSLSSSEFMFPNVAIVDSELTDSLGKEQTAETGIDAFSQAIEAYWNVNHNSVSDKYAIEAIQTIISNIENAVNVSSRESRDAMSKGSLLAGLAFSNTATTICHSVSYPMTAHWGIPHGQAVSVTLPSFIEYTLPILDTVRRRDLLLAIGVNSDKEAAEKIKKLMVAIGLKIRLSELGIPKEGINLIVSEGFNPDRVKNAPRIPSEEELKEMLFSIY